MASTFEFVIHTNNVDKEIEFIDRVYKLCKEYAYCVDSECQFAMGHIVGMMLCNGYNDFERLMKEYGLEYGKDYESEQ